MIHQIPPGGVHIHRMSGTTSENKLFGFATRSNAKTMVGLVLLFKSNRLP